MWPSIFGVWLYCLVKKEKAGFQVNAMMFSTGIAPLISDLLVRYPHAETIGFNALRNSVEDFDSEEAVGKLRQWNNFTPEEIANRSEEEAKDVLRHMTHINDITPRNFVEVCVDMKQQGVAGFNSWGDRPLAEHTMPANQEYKWGFTLIPVK